jgi:hypothetical protein
MIVIGAFVALLLAGAYFMITAALAYGCYWVARRNGLFSHRSRLLVSFVVALAVAPMACEALYTPTEYYFNEHLLLTKPRLVHSLPVAYAVPWITVFMVAMAAFSLWPRIRGSSTKR